MWYAVVEKATGRVHSTGTVLADEMPPEFEVIELGDDFDERGQEWDVPTKSFIPDQGRFITSIVTKFLDLPGLAGLSPTGKLQVEAALRRLIFTGSG